MRRKRGRSIFVLIEFLVAAANHAQRRADADDDEHINHLAPENSRIARIRAAKRQRQNVAENVSAPLSQIDERE